MAKKKEEKELAVKEEYLPSEHMDFESDAGMGFENADSDAYSIPYLIILQSNSPQVDEDEGRYVEGAKAGMIMNTVTNELFSELTLVPVEYSRRMVEWVPRDAGGGYRGSYDPSDPKVCDLERDENGRYVLDNGNFLNDTRYHFVLVDKGLGQTEPAVIALTSTQIKKSRNWMYAMNNIKFRNKDGKMFTPPSFSHKYSVSSVSEKNDKGSWKGWKFSMLSVLDKDEAYLYQSAKLFLDEIKKGAAEIMAPPAETSSQDSDVAF